MKVEKSSETVMLSFGATWCEPCKWAEPIMNEVMKNFEGKIVLNKIDIDKHPELARQYHVLSVPTFVLLKHEKEIWRMRGFDTAPNMIRVLDPHLSA